MIRSTLIRLNKSKTNQRNQQVQRKSNTEIYFQPMNSRIAMRFYSDGHIISSVV